MSSTSAELDTGGEVNRRQVLLHIGEVCLPVAYSTYIQILDQQKEVKTLQMDANTRDFETELEAQRVEVEEAPKLGSKAEVIAATAF